MADKQIPLPSQTSSQAYKLFTKADLFEDSDSDSEIQQPVYPKSIPQLTAVHPVTTPTPYQQPLVHDDDEESKGERIQKIQPIIRQQQVQGQSVVIDRQTQEKMQQLETTITEYRNKMMQLERLLKEEDDIRDDPDKREEVEKLRDQLKDNMILHLNELKFLQNSQIKLSKKAHEGRVCEAYFPDEKTWYAALILEVFEELQEVEVQWIGYKRQERMASKFVNPLTPPSPQDLFEGAACNAVFTQDGMWYPCVIEKVINDEKSNSDISSDLNAILSKYLVKFKHNQLKMTVPLDYIRITKDQMVQNQRKKELLANGHGADGDLTNLEDFSIPDHLRLKRSDTEKVHLQKRKKVKALKYQFKVKKQEVDSKQRQNTWLDFTNKAANQKQGHFAFKANQESIFKSPDTVMGKVGVVGSGKQMTTYDATKYKLTQAGLDGGSRDDKGIADMEIKATAPKRSRFE